MVNIGPGGIAGDAGGVQDGRDHGRRRGLGGQRPDHRKNERRAKLRAARLGLPPPAEFTCARTSVPQPYLDLRRRLLVPCRGRSAAAISRTEAMKGAAASLPVVVNSEQEAHASPERTGRPVRPIPGGNGGSTGSSPVSFHTW